MSEEDQVASEESIDPTNASPDAAAVAASAVPADIDWLNWLFRCNFTEFAERLQEVKLGVLSEESDLRAICAAFDNAGPVDARGLWSFDQMREEYSLVGVEVLYSGKNDRSFPTLSLWKNVLKLKFPAWSVNPPAGQELYMCFNDPVPIAEDNAE